LEAGRADRVGGRTREQALRVRRASARRVRDAADVGAADAAQLAARAVLLDLLLQRRGELDAGLLEEANLHHLRVDLARPDVEAGVVALRLEHVPRDRRRQYAEIRDLEPRRGEAADHRALDHAARRRRLAAGHDA